MEKKINRIMIFIWWALLLSKNLFELALMNLNIYTSYFSHAVNYSHEYVTFWYVWNIRTTIFEILIGMSFSQMSNFGRVFTCVTCEFFTRVTDSFECES